MLKASPYRWFCRVAQRFFPFCRSFFVVHFQTYSLFVAAVLPHVMHVAATCYAPDSCPKQKKLPCNTSRIDWQEHGNRLMEPWLVNCKRNTSGTAKKSVRKTIQRRTTSLTVAADLPMCRFFPDIHSLFVASNLRACRSILPFLSATTYQPVGRHGW